MNANRRFFVLMSLAVIAGWPALVGCSGSPTAPRQAGPTQVQVRISVKRNEATVRYPLLMGGTPLEGVRIETVGGPTPGLIAITSLPGQYTFDLPSPYDGQMIRLTLDGHVTYEAGLGGNANDSYLLSMNPSPHVLVGYLFNTAPGTEVEILDGVNAGRKTLTYAYSDSSAYRFEGLLTSEPFRLRIGTRVILFEGQSHPPSAPSPAKSFVPVRGLFHHAEFNVL